MDSYNPNNSNSATASNSTYWTLGLITLALVAAAMYMLASSANNTPGVPNTGTPQTNQQQYDNGTVPVDTSGTINNNF